MILSRTRITLIQTILEVRIRFWMIDLFIELQIILNEIEICAVENAIEDVTSIRIALVRQVYPLALL